MNDLKNDLMRRAIEEGFDLVGVAAAAPAAGSDALRGWLDAGMHGDMGYMARTFAVRTDPGQLLAGCRSVIAIAMSYHTDRPLSQDRQLDDEPRAWVSRYAWGRDYHRVMKKKLVRIGRWLADRRPGAGWRACVDTAPVLEREWAARAGVGWIGKNTSLLNRRFGSELFLGLLLTDLELRPDPPVADHCGSCTACLDACPTSAFPEPRMLDARRCIAYLTVEHRHPIPQQYRPAMGAMVAGCDICQEVCPWTARAPANLHSESLPAPHRERPPLAALEELDEDGFRSWRRGSPLGRIPFVQFRRNLATARENFDRRPRGEERRRR